MRALALSFVVLFALSACGRTPHELPKAEPLSLGEALGGSPMGFARALGPREFRFPEDHAEHADFRTEWWYTTGNLTGPDGEPYGFHFTIFRSGLRADPVPRTSRFAATQVWMAHFALTDGRTGEMHAFERFGRGAAGLAGSSLDPLAVWVDGWRLEGAGGDPLAPTLSLRAREGNFAIQLRLEAQKPLVLQGDRGLSQKGALPGSASYYYALTRLAATGTIEVAGTQVEVSGNAWLDREWSTSLLEPGQVGWDWFALQLNDGTDLMVYQMRLERDGGTDVDPASHGAWIAPDGTKTHLGREHYDIDPQRTWTSPRTGAVYPSGWQIEARTPDGTRSYDLTVTPLIPDQELDVSVVYWEGAVTVSGTDNAGNAISGAGYAELTGYAQSAAPSAR